MINLNKMKIDNLINKKDYLSNLEEQYYTYYTQTLTNKLNVPLSGMVIPDIDDIVNYLGEEFDIKSEEYFQINLINEIVEEIIKYKETRLSNKNIIEKLKEKYYNKQNNDIRLENLKKYIDSDTIEYETVLYILTLDITSKYINTLIDNLEE